MSIALVVGGLLMIVGAVLAAWGVRLLRGDGLRDDDRWRDDHPIGGGILFGSKEFRGTRYFPAFLNIVGGIASFASGLGIVISAT